MNKKIGGYITPNYNDNKDKVIISSEYYEDDRPVFMCSLCNRTLVRLTDAGQHNTTFFCRFCNVEFDPESENVRRESKLSVPDRNQEPLVTSIQHDFCKDITIRHEPEIKGGLKALQEKGLKITDYKEYIRKPKRR